MGSVRYTLSFYWKYTKKHPLLLVGSFLIVAGSAVINILSPLILASIIDKLITNDTNVTPAIIMLVLAGIVGILLDNIGRKSLDKLMHKTMTNITEHIVNHVLRSSYRFHVNTFSGALQTKVVRFENAYWTLGGTFFGSTLVFIVSTIISVVVLSAFSIAIAAVFVVFTLIFTFVSIKLAQRRTPVRRMVNRYNSERNGALADTISNALTVKAFSREAFELHNIMKLTRRWLDMDLKSAYMQLNNGTVNISVGLLLQIVVISIAVVGIQNRSLSVSIIVILMSYTSRLIDGLFKISDSVKNFEKVFSDTNEMVDILRAPEEIVERSNAPQLTVKDGTIQFSNVAFRYTDSNGKSLFKNMNLNISGGQSVGLVGPSGGGKTTITKLLLRFMDIQDGTITIDGQDIATITQSSLRESITYVPQEPLLFHRTISENIAYGKPSASKKEIIEAAKKANAHEFIRKLANQYDTVVGERGIKLSGGQRQRIALARALLKNSPIIVLDEATSALDSESEKLIQEALLRLIEGRTTIVVAHRLSTIKHLDRILVLENGDITEDGSHEELVKNKATYSQLWNHQSGGFIE